MPDYENQRAKVNPPMVPLSAVRAAKGLTQDQVAGRIAAITNKTFTKGAVSAIEGGHRGGSAEILAAMETVLGLPGGSLVVDYSPTHDRRRRDVGAVA